MATPADEPPAATSADILADGFRRILRDDVPALADVYEGLSRSIADSVAGHSCIEVAPRDGAPCHGTVLCLHGFPDNPLTFYAQLGAFARAGYRCLAPSLRGYDPATANLPNAAYALPQLALDAAAVLDAACPPGERVYLFGHDWGASVAAAAAARWPGRFRGAVLLAVPPNVVFAWLRHPSQLWRESWYFWFHMLPWLPERWLTGATTLRTPRGESGAQYLRRTWRTGLRAAAPPTPPAYAASVAAVLAQRGSPPPPADPTTPAWRRWLARAPCTSCAGAALAMYRANVGFALGFPLRLLVPVCVLALAVCAYACVRALRWALSLPGRGFERLTRSWARGPMGGTHADYCKKNDGNSQGCAGRAGGGGGGALAPLITRTPSRYARDHTNGLAAVYLVPLLCVTGARDGCIRTELFDTAVTRCPGIFPGGAEVLRVRDGGHWCHQECADEVNAAALRFFRENDALEADDLIMRGDGMR